MNEFDMILIFSFVVTWTIGLTPAIGARYLIHRQPMSRKTASWFSGVWSVFCWILFTFLNAAAENTRPRSILPWFLVFFVSRWILSRDYVAPAAFVSPRNDEEVVERLRKISSDSRVSPDRRAEAARRLAEIQDRLANEGLRSGE